MDDRPVAMMASLWDLHDALWGLPIAAVLLGARHVRRMRGREFLVFAGALVLVFVAALSVVSNETAPGQEDISYGGVIVIFVWLAAVIYLLVLGLGRLLLAFARRF